MKVIEPTGWVVYSVALIGRETVARTCVCTLGEWDALEAARPGYHTLIHTNISNEGEAERLARDHQAPLAPPKPARKVYTPRKTTKPVEIKPVEVNSAVMPDST